MKIRKNIHWEIVADNLRSELSAYLLNCNLSSLVIGESGGIDSALATALIRPICDQHGIKLIGRSISIETNTQKEIERAASIGNSFCHDFKEVDLTYLYHTTRDAIEEDDIEDKTTKAYKLRMGNIKARLRMVYLYNLAQKHKGMVISTDNQSEFLLGFWTLHGDVGDFNPLFGLWKSEVYQLARHIAKNLDDKTQRSALEACIACIPTDGLGITSSDVEQLGAKDYDEVDRALSQYVIDGSNVVNETVIERHLASAFKRENPIWISREKTFKNAF